MLHLTIVNNIVREQNRCNRVILFDDISLDRRVLLSKALGFRVPLSAGTLDWPLW